MRALIVVITMIEERNIHSECADYVRTEMVSASLALQFWPIFKKATEYTQKRSKGTKIFA